MLKGSAALLTHSQRAASASPCCSASGDLSFRLRSCARTPRRPSRRASGAQCDGRCACRTHRIAFARALRGRCAAGLRATRER
jgi:hypothetical protein